MGQSTKLSEFEQRIEQQFGLSRGILLAVGWACLLLGGVAMALPLSLFGSIIRLVGLSCFWPQEHSRRSSFFWAARSRSARERGWPLILLQVAIDVLMGLLLLNHWRASVSPGHGRVRSPVPVRGAGALLHGLEVADAR